MAAVMALAYLPLGLMAMLVGALASLFGGWLRAEPEVLS